MKSKRAEAYLEMTSKTLYTAQVWGSPLAAVRLSDAFEAVEIAEADAARMSMGDHTIGGQPVIPVLRLVRATLMKSEAAKTDSKVGCAILMLNKLLTNINCYDYQEKDPDHQRGEQ